MGRGIGAEGLSLPFLGGTCMLANMPVRGPTIPESSSRVSMHPATIDAVTYRTLLTLALPSIRFCGRKMPPDTVEVLMTVSRLIRSGLALASLGLFGQACRSDPASAGGTPTRGETLRAPAGQELVITLQTVGSGAYDSLPHISSSAIHFIEASFVPPHVPAGPTQRFRFQAATPGKAIIRFQHSGSNPVVIDTVIVE